VSRGLDLSGLSPAERVVAAGGALLFVDGFVPWWYRVRTPNHTYLHNAGLTGWGLAAVLMGFAATAAVLVHSTNRARTRRRDHALYVALGAVAVVALAIQGHNSHVLWIGFWVAGAAGMLIVAGGLRRRRERRGGWI
jgi:hypothetical protein